MLLDRVMKYDFLRSCETMHDKFDFFLLRFIYIKFDFPLSCLTLCLLCACRDLPRGGRVADRARRGRTKRIAAAMRHAVRRGSREDPGM